MAMQIRRTAAIDNPPAGLAEGQLAVEMAADPPRLWVGVPTSLDPTGRRQIITAAGGAGFFQFDQENGNLYFVFDVGVRPNMFELEDGNLYYVLPE